MLTQEERGALSSQEQLGFRVVLEVSCSISRLKTHSPLAQRSDPSRLNPITK